MDQKPPFFIPVIEIIEGRQVFRNDLVDISYTYQGNDLVRRFHVGENMPPPLPFVKMGRVNQNGASNLYVIDSMRNVWVENREGEMHVRSMGMFLMIMANNNPEEFNEITKLLDSMKLVEETDDCEFDELDFPDYE